jgi:purine-binding chemotaxis protein CheW
LAINRQKVIFKVGKEEFAIDIMFTKEIVVMGEITPVPETEEYVEGVMNLRGNLVRTKNSVLLSQTLITDWLV